jgi:D-arabinose 1-dehydrogenase-like Zn-dependent alcohol dehydrogenase
MKAIQFIKYGAPEKLLMLVELPKPFPENNQVLIKIKAAAVNDYDWAFKFTWNVPPQFPEIRNHEHKTWVVVELEEVDDILTRVSLSHLGWLEGEQWDVVLYKINADSVREFNAYLSIS